MAGMAADALARIWRSSVEDKEPHWLPFLRKIGNTPEQLAKIKFDVNVPR